MFSFRPTPIRLSGLLSAALLVVGSCTIVVRNPGPGGEGQSIRAHMLWAVSVDRSAVNLSLEYERIIRDLVIALALQPKPVVVEKIALVPLDRTFGSGPRLIYGENVKLPPLDGILPGDGWGSRPGDLVDGPGGAEDEPGDEEGGESNDGGTGSAGGRADPLAIESPDPFVPGGDGNWGGAAGRIATAIAAIAANPLFTEPAEGTPEQAGLAQVGKVLGTQVLLDPFTGGLEGRAFFDDPPDLLIVGTLGHLRRQCAIDDPECRIDGKAPDVYFTEVDLGTATDITLGMRPAASDPRVGTGLEPDEEPELEPEPPEVAARWIRYGGGQAMDPRNIFHLSFVTAEERDVEHFYRECSGTSGFPQGLVDFMEPSPHAYYEPLTERLSAHVPGRAFHTDLCKLLGSTGTAHLAWHAIRIAASVGSGD